MRRFFATDSFGSVPVVVVSSSATTTDARRRLVVVVVVVVEEVVVGRVGGSGGGDGSTPLAAPVFTLVFVIFVADDGATTTAGSTGAVLGTTVVTLPFPLPFTAFVVVVVVVVGGGGGGDTEAATAADNAVPLAEVFEAAGTRRAADEGAQGTVPSASRLVTILIRNLPPPLNDDARGIEVDCGVHFVLAVRGQPLSQLHKAGPPRQQSQCAYPDARDVTA